MQTLVLRVQKMIQWGVGCIRDVDGCIYDVGGCILCKKIPLPVQLWVAFHTPNNLRRRRRAVLSILSKI